MWSPPQSHMLKWNLDGSSIGKPSFTNVRGVFHNHKSLMLGFFFAFIMIKNSNEDEVLTVIKTFEFK